MKGKLTVEKDNEIFELETKILENPNMLKAIVNEASWEIVKILSAKPEYPAEIAKKLGMHEQKVYYHIRQLSSLGIIRIARSEEIKGALAKYYEVPNLCFSFFPKEAIFGASNKIKSTKERILDKETADFFKPIISNGLMNAKIVVGSPEPHGKFKARARDNHFAVELAAFFGSISEKINLPLVYLDTMIKPLEEENSNLIVIGGPITNSVCAELNEKMPIKFKQSSGHWIIKSEISGKEYSEDAAGIIEKIPHPYFKKRSILLIAGKRNTGTIAGIVALMKRTKEMVKPNEFSKKHYCRVIEGLDLNSDGLIDDVEVKE